MNEISLVFVIFMVLLPSFAIADSVFPNKSNVDTTEKNIYFCTRDLGLYYSSSSPSKSDGICSGLCSSSSEPSSICSSLSSSSSKSANNNLKQGEYDLPVKVGLSDCSDWFRSLKHCFFMHGEVSGSKAKKADGKGDTINLRIIDTIGYGSVGRLEREGVVGGENKEVMANSKISCVPVVKKIDIQNKTTTNLDGSQREFTTYDVWAQIVSLMEASTTAKSKDKKKYGGCNNNCCTIAYNVLVSMLGNNKDKANELIQPTSFNMYGLGIVWGDWMEVPLDAALGLVRYVVRGNPKNDIVEVFRWSMSSSDYSKKMSNDVVSKVKSYFDETKKLPEDDKETVD